MSLLPLPQVSDAGRYLVLAAVLLVFAVDKMLLTQQGPTDHVRLNTEMKDDIGNIYFLFLKTKQCKLCSCSMWCMLLFDKGGKRGKYEELGAFSGEACR